MSNVAWGRFAGWNMKSPTLKNSPHPWKSFRLARQLIILRRAHPDVFMAVEVGAPADARYLESKMRAWRIPLRLVDHGGKWRYIFVNPKTSRVLHSGSFAMATEYQGDEKELAWAHIDVNGSPCLFFAAHLENSSPSKYKVAQMREAMAYAAHLLQKFGLGWDNFCLYVDTNDTDPTQPVHAYLATTHVRDGAKVARKRRGTQWSTHNEWKPRIASIAGRLGRRFDFLGMGSARRIGAFTQLDAHTSSDHDALVLVALRK